MNFYRIHEFIIRPPEALSCSVESTAFFSFFFVSPLVEIVFKSLAHKFNNNACLVQKENPLFFFPIFYIAVAKLFFTPIACLHFVARQFLSYYSRSAVLFLCTNVFFVSGFESGGVCVCVFFFFGRFPPQTFLVYM